ncbi:MAG: FHA domain-containing protein [Gammaproteobacteria bacterium]
MDDDKTVFRPRSTSSAAASDRTVFQAIPRDELTVELFGANGERLGRYVFSSRFTAGRASDNDVVISDDSISRYHLEIKPESGGWWLYNLKSTNGVYIEGRLIQTREQLHFPIHLALGRTGIHLLIQSACRAETESKTIQPTSTSHPIPSSHTLSQAEFEARLLSDEESEDMGDYTLMVRRVIQHDRIQHRKSHKKMIWILSILFLCAAGLVAYQQIALSNSKKLAIDMFYDIKTLEVSLAQADIKLEENAEVLDRAIQAISGERLRSTQEQLKLQQERIAAEKQRMQQERERLANMKTKYRQYVEQANALRLSFPTAERYENELIADVARELGESELEVPDEFIEEVRKYIGYWQASSRLPKAIAALEQNDLLPYVVATLRKYGLSEYFVYLPLQESNYDTRAIGPETRFGIAKGAWQLLAGTAQQYGVTPGPLANVREYDEQDGRFDFSQATLAGIKYLKHIYSTEAQASGLLVMASYNYGDTRVRNMISQMPDNPRDRNFWKFLQTYELPAETRDYVFYIFSAAVIGEDPQHFGFKFNPPLFKQNS